MQGKEVTIFPFYIKDALLGLNSQIFSVIRCIMMCKLRDISNENIKLKTLNLRWYYMVLCMYFETVTSLIYSINQSNYLKEVGALSYVTACGGDPWKKGISSELIIPANSHCLFLQIHLFRDLKIRK